jgi:hypothetical protein
MLAENSNRKSDNFHVRKYRETEKLCQPVKHNLLLSYQLLFSPTVNGVHYGYTCVSVCFVCGKQREGALRLLMNSRLVYLVSGPVSAVQHTIAINMALTEHRSYIRHAIKIIATSYNHVVSCINTGNSNPIVQLSYSDCIFPCKRHSKVRRYILFP